jgi:dipeptidyl aminopeptidase/acylaminoacyl peptidase
MVKTALMQVLRIGTAGILTAAILLGVSVNNVKATQAENKPVGVKGKVRPLTLKDVIEYTRVLQGPRNDPELISPDGKRYLVVLERGDVARNGSWVELLSGSTASLDAASNGSVVARLFSTSTAEATELIKNVRWLDDSEHVAFLWDGGQRLPQVVDLDVQTHRMQTLTHHATPIVEYDISGNGQTLIFTAEDSRDPSKSSLMGRTGFAITDQSIDSLLNGNFDGWTRWLHYKTFVSSHSDRAPREVREPARIWSTSPELLKLSPDGRYAIAVRPVGDVPADWDMYTEPIFRDDYLPVVREHPGGPSWIRQYLMIDVQQATSRPLWNAPENPYAEAEWSPDSRSLLIGPTFLPAAQANAAGLSGRAVAEVNPTSGDFVQLTTPTQGSVQGYRPLAWTKRDVIELADATFSNDNSVKLKFKKTHGEWQPVSAENQQPLPPPVRIELRQDPNIPPALYAVETASGREQLIRDLDPQLRTGVSLGRVERVHWKATDGSPWTGMLYYPVHYELGRRFPLVIQTHGYWAKNFSLDGVFTTVFAAQLLANRDIAALQVGGPDGGEKDVLATPQEPKVFMAGFEGAIAEFVGSGLVDRDRVGIIGFSRTGWLVEYMLTRSQVPLAAAEVADNMDDGYVQYILSDSTEKMFSEVQTGARPIGDGLETWMRVAPGFNADKVRTPLRMEIDSGPISEVLQMWEMFSNLQYLGKPVELFVIPDIAHGTHVLQNPAQRFASQGGSVDWFCFWLKGEEDSDPAKTEQYERWRGLRRLQEQNHITAPAN